MGVVYTTLPVTKVFYKTLEGCYAVSNGLLASLHLSRSILTMALVSYWKEVLEYGEGSPTILEMGMIDFLKTSQASVIRWCN